jgi:hypothetical protein
MPRKQMILTTESGSMYNLDGGFCIKNGEFQFKIWWAYCFELTEGMRTNDLPQPFDEKDTGRRLPLQVGKCMYIGGKDGWWVSTPIVSIEEPY